jgi:hypothetical protein
MFMERIKKAGRVKAMAAAKVWNMFASRIVPFLWNREKGLKLLPRRVKYA